MSSSATKLSALALVPDVAAWPAIQALRFAHDRQVRIWPPHINLLYPFVSEAVSCETACQSVAAAWTPKADIPAKGPLRIHSFLGARMP